MCVMFVMCDVCDVCDESRMFMGQDKTSDTTFALTILYTACTWIQGDAIGEQHFVTIVQLTHTRPTMSCIHLAILYTACAWIQADAIESAAKADTVGEQQLKQAKQLVQHISLTNSRQLLLFAEYPSCGIGMEFYSIPPLVTHVQISSHSHH